MKIPKIGDKIYVDSHWYISRGSDDVEGGIATVSKINTNKDLPKDHVNKVFVEVKEHPGHSYNWTILAEEQDSLKKQFKKQKAHPSPDIDTPWIEDGDIVNGKPYKGKKIW